MKLRKKLVRVLLCMACVGVCLRHVVRQDPRRKMHLLRRTDRNADSDCDAGTDGNAEADGDTGAGEQRDYL